MAEAAMITDYPVTTGDVQSFFEKNPESADHMAALEAVAHKKTGAAIHLVGRVEALKKTIGDSLFRQGRMQVEYGKMGVPSKVVDGKNVVLDWAAPFRREQEAAQAEIGRCESEYKKIKRFYVEPLRAWCVRSARFKFRTLPMPTFEGDPAPILAAKRMALTVIEAEIRATENANADRDEVDSRIRADGARRANMGAVRFNAVLAGGRLDYNNNFQVENLNPTLSMPETIAFLQSKEAQGVVAVEDAINFQFFIDSLTKDQPLVTALIKYAHKLNAGKAQISAADKIVALKKLNADKLAAQRGLEAANRYAESNNVEVRRRDDIPPEVLLWVERDNTPTPTLVPAADKPAKNIKTLADVDAADLVGADAFEGEDK